MNNYDDTVSYGNEPQPLVLNTGEALPAGEGINMDHAASQEAMDAALGNSAQYFQYCSDRVTDDTLIYKDDGRPVPIKSMHRIFDLSDLKHLRGFSGDWVVSHIPEGQPIILQKKGKKAKAYNADMELVELTDDMKQEMAKVNDKDFIVHAVIDEKRLYFIDLLEAADEKTHNMPAKDRVRHLRAHFESSVHIKMPEPYNTKRTDDVGMPHVISLLREESSADILLRDAEGTYMRGEIRHPKWVMKNNITWMLVARKAQEDSTKGNMLVYSAQVLQAQMMNTRYILFVQRVSTEMDIPKQQIVLNHYMS